MGAITRAPQSSYLIQILLCSVSIVYVFSWSDINIRGLIRWSRKTYEIELVNN